MVLPYCIAHHGKRKLVKRPSMRQLEPQTGEGDGTVEGIPLLLKHGAMLRIMGVPHCNRRCIDVTTFRHTCQHGALVFCSDPWSCGAVTR